MTNLHEIRARDPERQRLEQQLSEFLAAGGIPEVVTNYRQSHMAPSQAERNAAAWANRSTNDEA
jgi:hypothetical protein